MDGPSQFFKEEERIYKNFDVFGPSSYNFLGEPDRKAEFCKFFGGGGGACDPGRHLQECPGAGRKTLRSTPLAPFRPGPLGTPANGGRDRKVGVRKRP